MRVLTFTSLFPSVARPRHGIFVETRLAHLVRHCGVDARVVAPVPWFPFEARAFGAYARFAATPRLETRPGGLHVTHPRYLMLPRVGVSFQPDSMARAAMGDILQMLRRGWQPDVIDAHYLYPDGVAAALLAERLKLPFVMTARGTDVNVLARLPRTSQRILWAAERAAAVIAVSTPLKDALASLGVERAKLTVLRNGVDASMFHPEPPAAARARFGLPEGPLVACVGNLVPEKGFNLAIDALRELPGAALAIVGDGPQRAALAEQAQRLHVLERVLFVPTMPQESLRHLYAAADALLLTSLREGWPNVVLEAMACGTPVVAVEVGAVRDMVTHHGVGRVVAGRDPRQLAAALRDLLADPPAREDVRRHAVAYDWAPISVGQFQLLQRAAGAGALVSSTASPCQAR